MILPGANMRQELCSYSLVTPGGDGPPLANWHVVLQRAERPFICKFRAATIAKPELLCMETKDLSFVAALSSGDWRTREREDRI